MWWPLVKRRGRDFLHTFWPPSTILASKLPYITTGRLPDQVLQSINYRPSNFPPLLDQPYTTISDAGKLLFTLYEQVTPTSCHAPTHFYAPHAMLFFQSHISYSPALALKKPVLSLISPLSSMPQLVGHHHGVPDLSSDNLFSFLRRIYTLHLIYSPFDLTFHPSINSYPTHLLLSLCPFHHITLP